MPHRAKGASGPAGRGKALLASERGRCAPCPAPPLLPRRHTWLLPAVHVCASPGFCCTVCVTFTLSLCFPQAQERVCGRVSVLTSTLHGALACYVRALVAVRGPSAAGGIYYACTSQPCSAYRHRSYSRGVPVGQCPRSRWRCTLKHCPSPQAVRLSICAKCWCRALVP